MKFTLHLKDGRWIGGFECDPRDVEHQLYDLHTLATMWKQPVVATRVDRDVKHEVHVVGPILGLELPVEPVDES